MTQAIDTPFGKASFFYDGDHRASLQFDQVKLGRILCRGTLYLKKNDNSQSWGDQAWRYDDARFYRYEGFMAEITSGARDFISQHIVPWMRNYLENPEIIIQAQSDRHDRLIASCEEEIRVMEQALQEKRDHLQKLRLEKFRFDHDSR
jgi:hypothetical protein